MSKFTGRASGSEKPFQGVVIGTEGEVSSVKVRAEHYYGLDDRESFALGGVIVALRVN